MSQPIAYFLTWTTYGSWLPGDQRGWQKKERGFQDPSLTLQRYSRKLMTEQPCVLKPDQRQCVENSIRSFCQSQQWQLLAVKCLPCHVHIVVSAHKASPQNVMVQIKAHCSKHLNGQMKVQTEINRDGIKPAPSDSEGINLCSQPATSTKGISHGDLASSDNNIHSPRKHWWTQRGCKKLIFDKEGLHAAIRYVVECQ
jgi:REP element-mobilizing transposase RayT